MLSGPDDSVANLDAAAPERGQPYAEPDLAIATPSPRQCANRLLAAFQRDRVERRHYTAIADHCFTKLDIADAVKGG